VITAKQHVLILTNSSQSTTDTEFWSSFSVQMKRAWIYADVGFINDGCRQARIATTAKCLQTCVQIWLLANLKKTRINTQISPSLKQPPASGDYYPDPDTVAPAVVVKFACCIVQTSRYGLYRLRSESENLFFFILQHLHYIA